MIVYTIIIRIYKIERKVRGLTSPQKVVTMVRMVRNSTWDDRGSLHDLARSKTSNGGTPWITSTLRTPGSLLVPKTSALDL